MSRRGDGLAALRVPQFLDELPRVTRRLSAAVVRDRTRALRLGFLSANRVGGAGFQLAAQILVARDAGITGLGVYILYTSWLRLGAAIAAQGYPQLLLRQVAVLIEAGKSSQARRLVFRSVLSILLAGSPFVIGTYLILNSLGAARASVISAAAVSAILAAGLSSVSGALKGADRPQLALTHEFTLVPLGLVICLGVAQAGVIRISAASIPWICTVVIGLCFASACASWRVVTRGGEMEVGDPEPLFVRPWARLNLAGTDVLDIALWTTPYLILPWCVSTGEVGLFGAAQRLVAIPSFVLIGLSSHFAPRFARTYERRDADAFRRNLRLSQVAAGGMVLPFFVIYLAAPSRVLALYGAGLGAATGLLVILTAGQALNTATGLASTALLMGHRERWELSNVALCACVLTVTTIGAASSYGVRGAAVAFTVVMGARQIMSFALARKLARELRRPAIARAGDRAGTSSLSTAPSSIVR